MTFKSDIEIAQATEMKPIDEIAASAGLPLDQLEIMVNTKLRFHWRLCQNPQIANKAS